MSILPNGRNGKLVLPAIPADSNQRDIARIYAAAGFPVHPWIRTRTKISARGKRRDGTGSEFHFNGPEVIETSDDIDLWADKWQVGFACSWRTGLVALDVDDPIAFLEWDIEFPETLTVSSGRMGGYHLYLDFRHLRAVVPQDEWPVQGDIPGGTLKTAGFTGAPGSIHPNNKPYRVVSGPVVAKGSLSLLRALASYRSKREQRVHGTGAVGYVGELLDKALAAGPDNPDLDNQSQHPAVRNLVNALEKEASAEAITGAVFPLLLRQLRSYDERDPWTERGLRDMLGSRQNVVASVEEERLLSEIAVMEPRLDGEGEDWFWNSREDLTTIRQWAQAQMVSPWALLGEVIADVVARVPPTFVLPDIIVGYGSLNMLLAITGSSGAGKGGAASVARLAISIDEPEGPDGKPFNPFMVPERIPIGSGEGLVKNYGHRADGQTVQHAFTSIPTAYEIDTLQAIMGRGSETLSSQMRHFYSGEQLGFGYSDVSKRIFIKSFMYRGVFIGGVQPERSAIIVHDNGSGFSQRWLFLDATDPWAPDVIPPRPEPIKWTLPRGLYDLDHDAGVPLEVMDVCGMAVDEIREARRDGRKGKGDPFRSHFLHTQEKFAAGLAVLAMRTALTEEDWRLAAYAMERSESLRELCLAALRKQKLVTVREEGRMDGYRHIASEDVKARTENKRLENLILKHVPDSGRKSIGKIANGMRQHPIDDVKATAREMAKAGMLVRETGSYNGSPVTEWYSKPQRKKRVGNQG
jgi:hypothetical protein